MFTNAMCFLGPKFFTFSAMCSLGPKSSTTSSTCFLGLDWAEILKKKDLFQNAVFSED